jgi:hypothetical protein
MLSRLDNIIFPDRCEVLEIVPSQRYVYPIYKNGSSSLYARNYQVINNTELKNLDVVDVFVRDPYERFLSGVQTFLLLYPQYDRKTTLLFISEYFFINRHFCPQFHWLVNLRRHTNARIKINHFSALNEITTVNKNKQEKDPTIDAIFRSNAKLHFYLSIDKVLTEVLIGQTVEFNDIVRLIKIRHPDVYLELIQRSKDLCNVLD